MVLRKNKKSTKKKKEVLEEKNEEVFKETSTEDIEVNEAQETLIATEITEEDGGVAHAGDNEETELVLSEANVKELVLGDGITRGLDISKYQAGISMQAIKNAGYSFVILRAGFTGWGGDGTNKNKDTSFETFYSQAKSVGLKVGAYWYSCADNSANGKSEAQYMINNCLAGKQFEFPIAMDVEDTHHQVPAGKSALTDAVVAFCEELENNGYYASIYANVNFFNNYLDTNRLKSYDKWLAKWTSSTTKPTNLNGEFGLWQNSSSGSVGGYRVDTNFCYKDYESIMKSSGLNGFGSSTVTPTPDPKPSTPTSEWPKYYTTKKGDSLSKIAAKYYGNGDYNHYMTIANANGISNPNIIGIGVTLTIPEYKGSASSTFNVGDRVRIISSYASSSSAKSAPNSAAIGWDRVIMKIYNGANYPYQVGDGKGVTGYCKATGLKKL